MKKMSKPIVAVVGRPNVGKSTLFNQIGKKRVSIVDDMPGVTRDRIYMDAEWLNHEFTIIDTGGIEFDESDHILRSMRSQAELAMEEACHSLSRRWSCGADLLGRGGRPTPAAYTKARDSCGQQD